MNENCVVLMGLIFPGNSALFVGLTKCGVKPQNRFTPLSIWFDFRSWFDQICWRSRFYSCCVLHAMVK